MRNSLTRAPCVAAALGLLALTGCDQTDPLTRNYVWHPTDVNLHNIAAQVDNPEDLLRGRESAGRRSAQESDAVTRLWGGKSTGMLSPAGGPATGGGAPAAAPPAGGS